MIDFITLKQNLQPQETFLLQETIFSMAYYDPLGPKFQATRLQIEKTILGLEERLLRRKELDLQIEKEFIEQQNLQRLKRHNHIQDSLNQGYSAQKQLQQRLRNLRTFDPREFIPKLEADYANRQALELDYLTRLHQIQRQQSVFARQLQIQKQPIVKRLSNQSFSSLDESGEILARKYYDGTRAIQYNQELKRSGGKGARPKNQQNFIENGSDKKFFNQTMRRNNNQKDSDHSTVKKYQSSFKNHKDNHEISYSNFNSKHSPIRQIQGPSKFISTTSNFVNTVKQKQHIGQHQRVSEKTNHEYSPHLQSKNIQKSRAKSTQSTNQLINFPSGLNSRKEDGSLQPKSNIKNSRYLSNRHQSSKSLHKKSATKAVLQNVDPKLPIQRKFKIWMGQRVKIGEDSKQIMEIFYAKDLSEYFITVTDKEDKLRKELNEKICKIRLVDRKYGVLTVSQ